MLGAIIIIMNSSGCGTVVWWWEIWRSRYQLSIYLSIYLWLRPILEKWPIYISGLVYISTNTWTFLYIQLCGWNMVEVEIKKESKGHALEVREGYIFGIRKRSRSNIYIYNTYEKLMYGLLWYHIVNKREKSIFGRVWKEIGRQQRMWIICVLCVVWWWWGVWWYDDARRQLYYYSCLSLSISQLARLLPLKT